MLRLRLSNRNEAWIRVVHVLDGTLNRGIRCIAILDRDTGDSTETLTLSRDAHSLSRGRAPSKRNVLPHRLSNKNEAWFRVVYVLDGTLNRGIRRIAILDRDTGDSSHLPLSRDALTLSRGSARAKRNVLPHRLSNRNEALIRVVHVLDGTLNRGIRRIAILG